METQTKSKFDEMKDAGCFKDLKPESEEMAREVVTYLDAVKKLTDEFAKKYGTLRALKALKSVQLVVAMNGLQDEVAKHLGIKENDDANQ